MTPKTAAREKPTRRSELKIVAIGNSRGVRLPKALLEKYSMRDAVVIEEKEGGLLLKSTNDTRLSWQETYKEMAGSVGSKERWSDFEGVVADGLDKIPW